MIPAEVRKGNTESADAISQTDLRQLNMSFNLIEWWVEEQHGGFTGSLEREKHLNREVDALLTNRTSAEIIAMGKLIGRIRANAQLAKSLELQSLYASSTLQLIITKNDWSKWMAGFEATEKDFEFSLKLRNEKLDPLRTQPVSEKKSR